VAGAEVVAGAALPPAAPLGETVAGAGVAEGAGVAAGDGVADGAVLLVSGAGEGLAVGSLVGEVAAALPDPDKGSVCAGTDVVMLADGSGGGGVRNEAGSREDGESRPSRRSTSKRALYGQRGAGRRLRREKRLSTTNSLARRATASGIRRRLGKPPYTGRRTASNGA